MHQSVVAIVCGHLHSLIFFGHWIFQMSNLFDPPTSLQLEFSQRARRT